MRCVLLHGFAGDPATWSSVGIAGDPIALPGHGGGPVLASWEANLQSIGAAIGACDVAIGYSLGARVALGLVANGCAARAVLISVNPGIADHERAARRASDAVLAKLLRAQGITAFCDLWEAQPLFATQARAAADRRAERRARRLTLDPEQLARSLESMGLAEMPDYHNAIDGRISLIAGADDAKYLAIARTLAAPLEVIASSGHDPLLEQPAALAIAISRALQRAR